MDLLFDWLIMSVRWWHVLAGITWIGASFYFNWFDSLVRPTKDAVLRENNRGVLHEVHGGNFYYHEQYYPDNIPQCLHAHAWPSKMTFISGLLLLVLVYWLGASSYMIDKSVAQLSPPMAIAISAGSIVLCWLIYNALCTATEDNRVVFAVMASLTLLATLGFQQVFGGRAAYISVGVMLGSLMGLNVWFVIAPKSIHMQQQLRAGEGYNRDDGAQAKRRSQHNNYFTIPVVLTMVSNHFATAYNHQYSGLILACLMFAGWGFRHALNVFYKYERKFYALYIAILMAIFAAIALSMIPRAQSNLPEAGAVSDQQLVDIIHARCVSCHSKAPTQEGFAVAPQGLELDSLEEIIAAAPKIRQRTLITRDMPLANLTGMTDAERNATKIALDRIASSTQTIPNK